MILSRCLGGCFIIGLDHEHYRTSLRIGRTLMTAVREPAVAAGVTECSACRIQMEQAADKPTLHPVVLLAIAAGLAPKERLIGEPAGRNV
jgi:Fe-S oxidoreductase